MSESPNGGPPAIVWLRQDLRLDGNPALRAASDSGRPVVPLFIWAPGEEGERALDAARRCWLCHLAAIAGREPQAPRLEAGREMVVAISPGILGVIRVLEPALRAGVDRMR